MKTERTNHFIHRAHVALAFGALLALSTACGKKDDGTGGMDVDEPKNGSGGGSDSMPDPAIKPPPADEFATYAALDVGADHTSWDKLNSKPVKSKTHGNRFVDTYVNKVGVEAYKNDDADIPVGTVIVKTSWETEGDKPTDVAGPIFIMERKAGENGGEATWWYGLHWENVPQKWQKAMGGTQTYWRTPSKKVGYCSKCHDNFPRELGGVPKDSRAF